MDIWKLPSPLMTTTGQSGLPIFAPMAEGRPYPIVPSPPEVMNDLGFLTL